MELEIEGELTQAIQLIGGVRASSIVGNTPIFENADFLFQESCVIAELKCLDEDKIEDERIIGKASQLYLKELRAGKAPVIAYGTNILTTEGFSKEYWQKIGDLYRIPIERVVRKADRQIQKTKQAISRQDDRGLLIIANNNHTALSPWHAKHLLEGIFQQPIYTNINNAIYFTANLTASIPGSGQDFDCWIEFKRDFVPSIDQNFLNDLRTAWYKHLATLRGLPEPSQIKIDENLLLQFDNKKRT